MASKSSLRLLSLPLLLLHVTCLEGIAVADPDYLDALTKSIIFYEGQRSGKLDLSVMRTKWRGDSALQDGIAQGVGLSPCSHILFKLNIHSIILFIIVYTFPVVFCVTHSILKRLVPHFEVHLDLHCLISSIIRFLLPEKCQVQHYNTDIPSA